MGVRKLRLITVQVIGQPARRLDQNDGRLSILKWLCDGLHATGWGRSDAVLLPAGFLYDELALGPLNFVARKQRVVSTPTGAAMQRASERLASVNGAVLVSGLDTRPYLQGFRGDQVMVAIDAGTVTGIARKSFASPIDTRTGRQRSYLAFEHDLHEPGRTVKLPRGDEAVLCPCYDAFVFGHANGAAESHRQYLVASGEPRLTSAAERGRLCRDLFHAVTKARPHVALIGIHGFDQPGRDTRWQRHGIACASSALGGGIAVGAAHFRYVLPDADRHDHSSLASLGVKRSHLAAGLRRKAHKLSAADSFPLIVPGSPHLRATVRLFEF